MPDGGPECLTGAGCGLSEQALQLGEGLLDWVQIGRVGREIKQAGAGGPDCFAHTSDLVGREVIQDHHVGLRQRWRKELADIGEEGLTGHGAVQHERRDEAGAAQACDEGSGAPVAVRRGVDQAFTLRAPAVAPDHIGGGAGLIEKDKALRVHVALPDPPVTSMGRYVGPVLLGRPQ